MAFGQEIYNLFPNEFYLLVHVVALLLGLYLASKVMKTHEKLSWFLVLYAISEAVHVLTHLGYTTLPFSHLVQEVLLLVGVLMLLMGMKK
ncbi:hypothetical protein HY572_01335 [Candidatus Micrarchaeota archaeon]|nr:hypothetical protein [Candidatus Micrarchaeota archaeon]